MNVLSELGQHLKLRSVVWQGECHVPGAGLGANIGLFSRGALEWTESQWTLCRKLSTSSIAMWPSGPLSTLFGVERVSAALRIKEG
jgi:hypothetical protein